MVQNALAMPWFTLDGWIGPEPKCLAHCLCPPTIRRSPLDHETWPTISHTHINEQVYQLLLSRIVTQTIVPGERLRVVELAEALGVSRTPVKDAINRLAVEGIVVVVPRKGTFVSDVTARSIRELFDVRSMIESFAGEQAVQRATDEDIAWFENVLTRLGGFVVGDNYTDFEAFLELDTRFHMRLLELADNMLLTKLLDSINHQIKIVRAYQRAPGVAKEADKTHHEHEVIVAAIKARDASRLRSALTTHFRNRRELIIRALEARAESLTNGIEA